jgi:hypothetical protein
MCKPVFSMMRHHQYDYILVGVIVAEQASLHSLTHGEQKVSDIMPPSYISASELT